MAVGEFRENIDYAVKYLPYFFHSLKTSISSDYMNRSNNWTAIDGCFKLKLLVRTMFVVTHESNLGDQSDLGWFQLKGICN